MSFNSLGFLRLSLVGVVILLVSNLILGAGMAKKKRIEVEEMTVMEMQDAMKSGKLTSKQLVEAYLKRIKEIDGKLNSIIEINPDAIAIAEQIGMDVLARVAGDVTYCIDRKDTVALAATVNRLMRTGEGSLTAVWDLQDITL